METSNIQSFIPQGPPFVMIDRLLHVDETSCRTALLVREDNIFVSQGKFREPGLLENMAQTAAAKSGHTAQNENKAAPVGYIGAIKNLQIKTLPETGEELTTEIIVTNQIFDAMVVTGKIYCRKNIIAQCEMKIFINTLK